MVQKQTHCYLLLQFLLIASAIVTFPLPVLAQRFPIADDTLGDESSIVSPDEVIRGVLSNRIDGGARRGANLFHSFREFNVDEGRGVFFGNPDGVANILTRVTEGSRSEILGTLGILGNANLFLLNPNGILFGSGARLDIAGSFISSTANSFVFDNGLAFSATDPQAPTLLTVNVPIGLQYGNNPGGIQVQQALLKVPNGQTLMLAGGTVNVDGINGQLPPQRGLIALGGRVELAGIAAPGEVGLTQQGQEWRLSVPEELGRADVAIGNNALVDVAAGGGGSIAITARNFTGTEAQTWVRAGIAQGSGNENAQAGDIAINAIEDINLDALIISNTTFGTGNAGNLLVTAQDTISLNRFAAISSGVQLRASGQAGDINITTDILSITNGGFVGVNTFGQGDAGNINITARDRVSIDGIDSNIESTVGRGFLSPGFSRPRGQGGEINITTGTLSIINGAKVTADTASIGNAGDITITARNGVVLDGVGVDRSFSINGISVPRFSPSTISSLVDSFGVGKGGNIRITTDMFSATDGGTIDARTFSQGDAGNITITARDRVFFGGVGSDGFVSAAVSSVGSRAVGQGGDIRITTGSLSFANGAFVTASTFGRGDAGNITIRASDTVSFDGAATSGFGSRALSSVETGALGRGGNIRITADSISLTDGAQVNATTAGQGRAGNIFFNAPTLTVGGNARVLAETNSAGNGGSIVVNAPAFVNLRRTNNLSPVLSVQTKGTGQAGDITINTPRLTLAERARITATATATATNPQGGGSITLNASDLNLAGVVGVFAETQGQAPAGTLRLNPYDNQPNLDITLTPGSRISASTSGSGNGGDLIVTAPRSIAIAGAGRLAVATRSRSTGDAGDINFTTRQLILQEGVTVSASTSGTGRAGAIGINAETFTLSGGSRVSTNTSSSGAAGDLTIQVNDRLLLTGQGTGLFASTDDSSRGNGGNITIDPRLVQIEDGATIAVDSQGRGTGGNISLQANQLVLNQGSISAETDSTQGGNIRLQVPDALLLRRGSTISTTAGRAQAGGNGGNIIFNGNFIVALPNENSDISANAFTGRGGDVQINAESIFGIQSRSQQSIQSDITASSARGVAGVVTINTPDVDPSRGLVQLPVDVTDASRLIAQTCPTGDATAQQPNEFIVTGRGGLPPTPSEAVNRDAIQVDLVTADVADAPSVLQEPQERSSSALPVVEAQGWQVAADGEVILVAAAPQPVFSSAVSEGIAPSPNSQTHCH